MKIILFLLSTFFIANIYCQEIKQYSGEFKDSYAGYGDGFANYQYYENDNFERIYQGTFEYQSVYGKNEKTNITGAFYNNKKTGKWTYTRQDNSIKLYVKIQGNYKNGHKDGLWIFSQKKFKNNKENEIKYNLNFKNDTIIGEINLKNLKGQFDENGKFIGKWKYQDGTDSSSYETLAEFNNNVLVKLIDRRISTGEIYAKYIPALENLEMKENLDINKKPAYSKIYGLANEYEENSKQRDAIHKLFNEVGKTIERLRDNEFYFILLDYFPKNEPEFITTK